MDRTGPLRVRFCLKSTNRKTGPIPVSMTSAETCPPTCSWMGAGCYAEQHFVSIQWKRINGGGKEGMSWDEFCVKVCQLPDGQIWRHNEAGDLPGEGNCIDEVKLKALVMCSRGKRGFTTTHKPLLPKQSESYKMNRRIIEENNSEGFSINLSSDTLEQADILSALSIAPVTVVLPSNKRVPSHTPAGRKIVTCPAVALRDFTCHKCRLCCHYKRKSIIAFPVHGVKELAMNRSIVQLRMCDK